METREKIQVLLYDAVSVLITATIILAILFTFFFRFVGVIGNSMNPILTTGDYVLLNEIGSNYKPHYGDVVVISRPGSLNESIIKRVIATEGETINIDFGSGKVFLDGAEIVEPYINNSTNTKYDMKFPLEVPEGYCFVMGDNRQGSIDSRSTIVGLIDNRSIIGKATKGITQEGIVSLDVRDFLE